MTSDRMTPDGVREYITRNSSPVRLRAVGEVYATHPDSTMRKLSSAAFIKLAGYRDTIPADTYDPSLEDLGQAAPDPRRLNT